VSKSILLAIERRSLESKERPKSGRKTAVPAFNPVWPAALASRLVPTPSDQTNRAESLRSRIVVAVLFANHLAGEFNQSGQDVKGATAEQYRLVASSSSRCAASSRNGPNEIACPSMGQPVGFRAGPGLHQSSEPPRRVRMRVKRGRSESAGSMPRALRGRRIKSPASRSATAPAEYTDWVLAPHLVEAMHQQTSRTSSWLTRSQFGC